MDEEKHLLPSEEPSTKPLDSCTYCGTTNVLQSHPGLLCADCRTGKRLYVPNNIKLFAGIIAILFILAIVLSFTSFKIAIHEQRGLRAEKNHQYLTAQREFAQVVSLAPTYLEGQIHLSISAFYNNDLDVFNTMLQQLDGKEIEDQMLVSRLNALVLQQDQFLPDSAFSAIKTSYRRLGSELPDSMIESYAHNHPGAFYANFEYANLLNDKNAYTASDSIVEHLLQQDNEFLPALMLYCSNKRMEGNSEAALRCCDHMLEINAEYTPAIASKARTYLLMHKDQDALHIVQKALELDSTDPYSFATLALAYHYNNRPAERDRLIQIAEKDTLKKESMKYIVDVINNRVHFRD